MHKGHSGFSRFVGELSGPVFLEQHWRKRPWFRAPDRDLLADCMEMIGGPDVPGLVARAVGISAYDELKNIFRVHSPELARYLYEQLGLTLYMYLLKPSPSQRSGGTARQGRRLGARTAPGPDATETGLSKAQRAIGRALGCGHSVYASVFAVRPPTAGTPLHCDNNENLTVQLRGTKRWRIASTPVVPGCVVAGEWNEDKPFGGRRLDEFEFEDVLMEPGAALYVPRGHLHEVTVVGDDECLSFNLSVDPITWTDDIVAALREIALDEEILRHCPNALDADLTAEAATAIERVRGILNGIDAQSLVGRVRQRFLC
jgi:hypothetical protein